MALAHDDGFGGIDHHSRCKVPERARQLDTQAEKAALSRLYGGIHYRFDNEAGLTLGRTIAAYVVARDVVGHQPFKLK